MGISLYDYSIKLLTGTATSFSFLYIVYTYSSVPDVLNYIYYGTFKTYLIFFLDIFLKLLTTNRIMVTNMTQEARGQLKSDTQDNISETYLKKN